MTPEERAERLTPPGGWFPHTPEGLKKFRARISAQIIEAVVEAVAAALKHWTVELVGVGKDEAYEDAAKIAEDICPDEEYGDVCHESIPRRIRARAKELNG